MVVSSDDEEALRIAERWGAEIEFRDPNLATDDARVKDVCVRFLGNQAAVDRHYDILAVLYATAPLRTAADVRAVVNLIKPGYCHYALATTRYPLPPHQALKRAEDGSLEPMWADVLNRRSSEIPELEVDNGSTYAVYIPAFLKATGFYGPPGETYGHLMPRERSVDIDTREDMELASYYYSKTQ